MGGFLGGLLGSQFSLILGLELFGAVDLVGQEALADLADVAHGVVQAEAHGGGEAEPHEHQVHGQHHELHAALHLAVHAGELLGDEVGDEHGHGGHDGEDGQRGDGQTGSTGHLEAQEIGVEVLDGRILVSAQGGTGNTALDLGDEGALHHGHVVGGDAQFLAGGGDHVGRDTQDVLHGAIHDLDNAEQDQQVQQHGQAAGHGVVPVFLLQLHQLFVLFFLVVLVLLLDLIDQRLVHRHLGGGFLLLDGQGQQQNADDHGENDHRDGVVGDDLIDKRHQGPQDECEKTHSRSIPPRPRPGHSILCSKVFTARGKDIRRLGLFSTIFDAVVESSAGGKRHLAVWSFLFVPEKDHLPDKEF